MFDSALGFNQTNADDLTRQILKGINENKPVVGAVDGYGSRFSVDITVTGPKGTGVVRTAWIYDSGSTTPRLTSVYVR